MVRFPRADTCLHGGRAAGGSGRRKRFPPLRSVGMGSRLPRDPCMRKVLFFICLLSVTAAWMVGCGSSSNHIVPPPTTKTSSFAFMQEVGSGSGIFTPMVGTFSTTGGTTTFSTSAAISSSTQQPIEVVFDSIYLSTDATLATLDLFGGLDGTSDQMDIWVVQTTGSHLPTQVTNDTNDNYMPQLSSDNTRVAFNSYRVVDGIGDSVPVVVTRKIDGTGEHVLALPPGANWTFSPTYSPDGSKIAAEAYGYDSTNGVYFDGIWVMNAADGSSPTMLTNPLANCNCYDETPAYTPDGTKIVFSRETWNSETSTETEDIYIMNADGTGVTQLTNKGAITFDPMVLSVNGTLQILFSSNQSNPTDTTGGSFDLYSMNMDGTGVTRLTTNSQYDAFCGEWYQWGDAAAQAAMRHAKGPRHSRFIEHRVAGLKWRR